MSIKLSGFDKLADNIGRHADRLEAGVVAAADLHAQRAQNYARQNRRWTDRTGNARNGLRAFVEHNRGKGVTIYLTTQMGYGVNLELKSGGKLAIILPTIAATSAELADDLRSLTR